MDNFNLRNMQLAYTAVYDQNLCESMEELGLIGEGNSEQDQFELWVNELLDEGYDLSDYTWDELGELYEESAHNAYERLARERNKKKRTSGGDLAARHARRSDPRPSSSDQDRKRRSMTQSDRDEYRADAEDADEPSGPGGMPKGKKLARQRARGVSAESYDAFDVVLEYLLDEGFAETIEGAEAIMVNMSEGWIEGILEAREPGVKPYRPNPTMAEINAAGKKKKSDSEGTGYGKDFNKPEHSSIPNKEWLKKAAAEKKTFGRPIGKYDPAQIRRGDIERKFPENSPGAKPRRIPSRLDKK